MEKQKGFTLIELLIVVAILGILAAVVIPNVGRFLGRGEQEAQNAEFQSIQAAVQSMLIDNNLTQVETVYAGNDAPCLKGTQDMQKFPDSTSIGGTAQKLEDSGGVAFMAADDPGWMLWGVDVTGGGVSGPTVNYTNLKEAQFCYTVDIAGSVVQWAFDGVTQLNP